MPKINIDAATGKYLDYCVALAEGYNPSLEDDGVWLYPATSTMPISYTSPTSERQRIICQLFSPTTEWHTAGEIIRRERISIHYVHSSEGGIDATINCSIWEWNNHQAYRPLEWEHGYDKDNALVAAMRCWAKRKLGDVVDIPDHEVENDDTCTLEDSRD